MTITEDERFTRFEYGKNQSQSIYDEEDHLQNRSGRDSYRESHTFGGDKGATYSFRKTRQPAGSETGERGRACRNQGAY